MYVKSKGSLWEKLIMIDWFKFVLTPVRSLEAHSCKTNKNYANMMHQEMNSNENDALRHGKW